jgi:acetolactate synthase I/II/III large subunit
MTVAEYVANQLFEHGVRFVFGIPGGPSIPYLEAFRVIGIEFILVSNEASAGIMSDVMARLTGIPGVCHSTMGPGATNLSTGVGEALLDRSPVLVLTSEIGEAMINRIIQMNISHQDLFKPLTKASFRINAGNVQEVMASALKICVKEYPGPVHIGLPTDIHSAEIELHPVSETPAAMKVFQNDLTKVRSLLENSRRPVLAAGLTAARHKVKDRLLAFLERKPMPVIVTPMAKELIPVSHPCFAGVLFHSMSNSIEEITEKADLVIGLGYDPVEFNYESWMPDVPLVHFDIQDEGLPSSGNLVRFTGQPEEWFDYLESLDHSLLVDQTTEIKNVRRKINSAFQELKGHFGPAAVLEILQDELPDDVILTADVGSHLHLAGQYWEIGEQGKFLITNGWSGMGFGIPAALAVQLNEPAATVACITGDGGFLMMAGEIITARRYNLPIKVIVFSDGELNLIKVKQSWKELSPYGTILYDGDLFGSESFLGIRVIRADSHQTMRSAVRKALCINEPVIINAVIDPEEYKRLIVIR